MTEAQQNYQFQKWIVTVAYALFAIKLFAWYATNSVAILTDALESTVNVISSLIGLYSLMISAKPKDKNHPYGHGKAEFLSAAVEGTLIAVAGIFIIFEAINNLKHPHQLGKLDIGMGLIGISALINYLTGAFAIQKGKKNNSLALIASGKHLQSDTWSTLGIMVGLALLWVTKLAWIDSAVALVFALFIIYTGYGIVRSSLAGIMDEADEALLEELVQTLESVRSVNWIDLHNLRIIKYGSTLHLDCHLTIPWYLNIHQGHDEVDALEKVVKTNFGESLELFVHTDGCLDFSCVICQKADCLVRQMPFQQKIVWTVPNISQNGKHRADTDIPVT